MSEQSKGNKAIKLTGKQKAAIVMMMLGLDDAANVTKHMNQLDVRELAEISSNLNNVPKSQLESVLKEFLEYMPAGMETVSFDEDFSSEIIKRSMGDRFFSLDFLQRADEKQVYEIIRFEHPQVIAFILSYVPADRAANILSQLAPEVQADIVKRISAMEPPSIIALRNLDKMLGEKLNYLASSGTIEVGGIDSLVKIMRGVGRNSERVILEQLENTAPELAQEIKERMFVFEDIVLLDNKNIQKVLKEVSMNVLALALKKATPEINELIMKNLSERARAALNDDMQSMGKVPLKEVEAAQQEVVEVIRRMEEAGEITIHKEEEVYV